MLKTSVGASASLPAPHRLRAAIATPNLERVAHARESRPKPAALLGAPASLPALVVAWVQLLFVDGGTRVRSAVRHQRTGPAVPRRKSERTRALASCRPSSWPGCVVQWGRRRTSHSLGVGTTVTTSGRRHRDRNRRTLVRTAVRTDDADVPRFASCHGECPKIARQGP